MTKEQKERLEYHKKLNKVMMSPEFKYIPKLNGADLDVILSHFISKQPIGQVRARLKKKYGMENKEITKLITLLKNKFEHLGNL